MKKILILVVSTLFIQQTIAQDVPTRVITTGVPFLLIAADARSAGMGDQGVATSTDAFSQQYNPAKYAFSLDKQGFSIGYTPYLSELVNDISLGQVNYFNRLNEFSAVSGSLRYFSLGEIQLTDQDANTLGVVKPAEFTFDLAYSLKLSERFSLAVGGRFVSSNLRLASNENDATAGNTFAVDVAGFYQSEEIAFDSFNGRWRAGFNFQNMGPKISYEKSQTDFGSNFMPANMRLGAGFDFILDDYNKVSLNTEITKLLVPTPQIPDAPVDTNNDGDLDDPDDITAAEQKVITNENYKKIGWSSGIFKSFNDAPDGFSEELKEFTYSVGSEYMYQDSFALRLGYFHESPVKGARQFFTLGAGFKYSAIKVDVSYLFSASKVKNPLENTLRFSLSFAFGDKYDEY